MTFLSELRFASALVYSRNGGSAAAAKSRELRDRLKRGDRVLIDAAAGRIAEWLSADLLEEFFGSDAILVPVPGNGITPITPRRSRHAKGGLWIARDLCGAIHEHGHGAGGWPGLRRTRAVPKSAFAAPGQRPTLRRHHETMA